jgi:uncharacterized protein (TIGR02147 family)
MSAGCAEKSAQVAPICRRMDFCTQEKVGSIETSCLAKKTKLPCRSMASAFDVYQFDRLTPLLKDISSRPLTEGRRPLSLQNWATRLGYRSPRSVGMVFRGQRLPSVMMIQRLSKILKLNFEQKEYLFTLLAFEKLKGDGGDAEDLQKVIRDHNPVIKEAELLDPSRYEILTDWCHIVIKQMIRDGMGRADVETFRRRLKGKVSDERILRALANLQNHGLIRFDQTERVYRVKKSSFATAPDIPSEAVRKYHREMLVRAAEAIDEEPVDQREFATATFTFDRKNMNEVKNLIRQFRDRLEKLYATNKTDDVFQLNLQFFAHTTQD